MISERIYILKEIIAMIKNKKAPVNPLKLSADCETAIHGRYFTSFVRKYQGSPLIVKYKESSQRKV